MTSVIRLGRHDCVKRRQHSSRATRNLPATELNQRHENLAKPSSRHLDRAAGRHRHLFGVDCNLFEEIDMYAANGGKDAAHHFSSFA